MLVQFLSSSERIRNHDNYATDPPQIDRLRSIINDPQSLLAQVENNPEKLMKDLKRLAVSGPEGKSLAAKALITPNTLSHTENRIVAASLLADRFRKPLAYFESFLDILGNLPQEDQINIMSGDSVLAYLQDASSNRTSYSATAANLILTFPADQQYRPLAAAFGAATMVELGHEQWVWEYILAQPTDRQAAILKSYSAVGDLTQAGYGDEVWNLITGEGKFSRDDRAVFLIHNIEDLAVDGKSADVIDMMRTFTPDQIETLLITEDALISLAENGYGQEAIAILESLPAPQQERVLARSKGSKLKKEPPINSIDDLKKNILRHAPRQTETAHLTPER